MNLLTPVELAAVFVVCACGSGLFLLAASLSFSIFVEALIQYESYRRDLDD